MSSQAEINAQNQRFLQALNAGEITYQQYQQAMTVQNQKMQQVGGAPATSPAESPYSSQNVQQDRFNVPVTTEETKILASQTVPQAERQAVYERAVQRQQQRVASMQQAQAIGLPADVGARYDVSAVVLQPGEKVTGYTEQQMIGPLLPNQTRPSQLKLEVTQTQPQQPQQQQTAQAAREGYYTQSTVGDLAKNPLIALFTGSTGQLKQDPVLTGVKQLREDPQRFIISSAIKDVGLLATVINPAVGLGGALVSVGVSQGAKSLTGGGLLTREEVLESGLEGAAFSVGGAALIGGIGKLGSAGAKIAGSTVGRAGVFAGMGATVSGVASGGDVKEIAIGAATGAAFSFGGDILGRGISRFRGGKGYELTGMKEIERQVTTGKVTEITRLSEPIVKQTRLTPSEVKLYRDNLVSDLKVDLAGSEKVALRGRGETLTYQKPTEATRSLTPILKAVEGKPYRTAASRKASVSKFLETPSDMQAVELTKVTVGTKGRKTLAVYAEKTIKTPTEAILPEIKLTERTYTGVTIRGKIDPQVYSSYTKNIPREMADSINKQLGGQYRNVFEGAPKARDLTGPMKSMGGSRTVGKSNITPSDITKSTNNPILKTATRGKTEITLPKNVIKIETPTTTTRTSSTVRLFTTQQRQEDITEDYTETVFSYPSSGLKTPSFIPAKTNLTTQQQINTAKQSSKNPILQTQPSYRKPNLPTTSFPIIKDTPSEIQKYRRTVEPDLKIVPDSTIRFDFAPIVRTKPRTDIKQSSSTQTLQFIPSLPVSKSRVQTYPFFRTGGGAPFARAGKSKRGEFTEKTNPVKTYRAMLASFGIGGRGKRKRRR